MSQISQLKARIQRNPHDPELHYDLGGLQLDAGEFEAAIESYHQANRLYQNHPQILLQLGNTYAACGRHTEAVKYFKQSIQADSGSVAAYYNLGNALRTLGRAQEALQSYQQALKLNPYDADVHNNLGNVQRELGQLDLAVTSYRTALRHNPNLTHAKVHLVHQKQHMCDWDKLEDEIAQIRDCVKNQPQAQVSPFAFLSMPGTTAAEQKQCAINWVNNRYQAAMQQGKKRQFQHAIQPKTKLRIGYLSADFRLHPLAFLITELIELHDKNRSETFAYSYGPNDHSAARQRLEQAFDHFRDIRDLSDSEAAERIFADGIDILIDLTGFTQTSRTAIAALRPAPIQINWLGFPGTMGAPFFDYLLTDAYIIPPEQAKHYTEKLLYLPCYQPNDRHRPVGEAGTRQTHHLPEDAFVFCCFNQSFKITAAMFAVWMRLLKQVPHSVLWLLDCNPWATENLRQQAQFHGIDAHRLIFAPRIKITEHLARHIHADLFLDTLPYNAHTTTSDALWMGLPVITCMGETFAGRVAASLLITAGLPELVCNSLQSYEEVALQLAKQMHLPSAFKQKIQRYNKQNPLFDTPTFAKNLERILHEVWQSKQG